MQKKQLTEKEIFETLPVPKAISAMAVPTIISQLINLIYNMADTFYIGRTGDAYKTAAVTVAFTIFMMTVAFSNLFGIGGGSLIARLSGSGRQEDAKRVSAFSFYGAVGISLAYSALIGIFLEPVLRLLGASDLTIGFAKQYVLLVIVLGSAPVILSMTCAHLLRNAGYSRQASIGLSGGGILNIALDPLFMFVLLPPGMEVVGAAAATLLSNIVSAVYLIITVKRVSARAPLSISLRDARSVGREEIRELFSVGVPSAVLTGLVDVGNIFLNSLTAAYGDLELAAVGIVMKVSRLPNAINVGICQGMLPIVAYNYAAGNTDRMNAVIRSARIYGLVTAFAGIAVFEAFAAPISGVFLSTSAGDAVSAAATLAYAAVFLRIRCLAAPVQFMNFHTSFCLQAVGSGLYTFMHALARELVFGIPLMYLLNALFGIYGLVSAIVAGEACGMVFALVLLRLWKKRHLSSAATGG